MPDIALVVAPAASFAWLVTAQVAILLALVRRRRPWRALSGLLFPPLAPYWAARERMRLRAALWLAGLVLYGLALLAAHGFG